MVYNGDEVSALVVDFGSYTTRAGYAGEDCPRIVCPSFYGYTDDDQQASSSGAANGSGGQDVEMSDGATGNAGAESQRKRRYYVGEDGAAVWRKDQQVGNFMLDGVLHEPEPAAELLHHILHQRLSVDPSEHPLMLTEPAWNTTKAREQMTEMAFEGEKVPALYFGSTGVLSAFAAGKPTALVLDVGYANSSAVPVVDGYALRAGTKRQPLASHLLTSQLHAHFSRPSPTSTPPRSFPLSLLPRQLISKRIPSAEPGLQPRSIPREDRAQHTTPSWRQWAENNVVENWKEACAEMIPVGGYDTTSVSNMAQVLYEFPDGYHQMFGEERYRFTEMFANPKQYFDQSIEPPAALRMTPSSDHSHSLKEAVPLAQLVHDSIMACDVDIRAALLQNIVVVGNGAGIKGLTERLDADLSGLLPGQKIKLHAPTIPYEKRYAGWLGGSILSSLGTFHQLWITKDEYEEHGMQIVHQREFNLSRDLNKGLGGTRVCDCGDVKSGRICVVLDVLDAADGNGDEDDG